MERCNIGHQKDFQVFTNAPEDLEYFFLRDIPAYYDRFLSCNSILQRPTPSAGEANSFYGKNYQIYTGSRVPLLSYLTDKFFDVAAKNFVKSLGKLDFTILDFGCGQGLFLKLLAKQGANKLYGYEVALRSRSVIDQEVLRQPLSYFMESVQKPPERSY